LNKADSEFCGLLKNLDWGVYKWINNAFVLTHVIKFWPIGHDDDDIIVQ